MPRFLKPGGHTRDEIGQWIGSAALKRELPQGVESAYDDMVIAF
jgi:hypothetical protein